MTSTIQTATGPVDEHGVISADLNCKRCSYNLRGLRETGRCPECGTPIGLSIQGDLLCSASPKWLGGVARGMTVVLVVTLLSAVWLAGTFHGGITPGMASLLGSCLVLLSFCGVWLMTMPDRAGARKKPILTASRVVRVTLAIQLAGQALCMLMLAFAPEQMVRRGMLVAVQPAGQPIWVLMHTNTWGGSSGEFFLLLVFAVLMTIVGELAKLTYYGKLAARIPNDALARWARLLRLSYTPTAGLAVLHSAGKLAETWTRGGAPWPANVFALSYVGILAELAFLVLTVLTMILLLRLRRGIAEQARLARATWAAVLGPEPMQA